MRRLIDIGVNLTDKVFRGVYRGKRHHPDDLQEVLTRCFTHGMEKLMITSGSLTETEAALELCRLDNRLFCTAGCHPTRCSELNSNPTEYLLSLKQLVMSNRDKVIAVGECGLDYDREQFCPVAIQHEGFKAQLRLASEVDLPLFLHCRAAHDDFINLIEEAQTLYFHDRPIRGVVHTFDGSSSDAKKLLKMGFYLGLNGCSLKTEDNLEVVKSIPLDRILLETDAPWCEIRPTHASYKYVLTHFPTRKPDRWDPTALVKGRNEPVNLIQVLEVVAAVKGIAPDVLAEQVYQNTFELFHFPYS